MYNFIEVTEKEIDIFNESHKKGHIFQSPLWGKVKKDWLSKYIAGYDNKGNAVLTALILLRKIPYVQGYIGYIPRGLVCDYTNKELLVEATEFLREFSKKHKVAFLTIDPDIHLKENEEPLPEGEQISSFLQSIDFKHKDSKNFEGIQPNFVFRLNLPVEGEKEAIKKEVFNSFSSKTRYNIKVAEDRGLSVEVYDSENLNDEILTLFHNIMVTTGKRDNFIIRHKEYFKDMIDLLYPKTRLYMIKYSYEKDSNRIYEKLNKQLQAKERAIAKIEEINNEISKESDEAKVLKLNKKLSDTENKLREAERQIEGFNKRLEDIAQYKGQEIYLSGAIYMYHGGKAWYLYGASEDFLRDAMPNFLMQQAMINDSIDLGCYLYDFRGVSGDLNPENPLYGLYKFKKGFNGNFVEFIGEFDLVINPIIYNMFKYVFPKFKEIRNKLRNR